ncbi:hypothetical protein PF008_g13558 [Phytophthora fragariae]|uniref:Secreted protein n=1 Tax=Phytophthora fragariae TaxID=53985 RepID=A0A6G0RKF5_9STRA|nr:hypothetical protein PF008_g13558 [Phytophthora fragariae]
MATCGASTVSPCCCCTCTTILHLLPFRSAILLCGASCPTYHDVPESLTLSLPADCLVPCLLKNGNYRAAR